MVSLLLLSILLSTIELNFSVSNSDFPVTTPPRLTQAEYLAFLDSLPVHSSLLFFAVRDGNVEEMKEILVKNPNLDFNWMDATGKTALQDACENDWDIVSILLVHPDIDVNLKDGNGWTPFYYACWKGFTSCVRLLLKDRRVKLNEPDDDGRTPLWRSATWFGHLDIIKWWIASGREMDLGTPGDVDKTDAVGVAKKYGKTEVASLLERFKDNLVETRHQVRVELGLLDELAAEMFALVVFVSDGLLQINDTTTPSPAARFFSIAARLPLELQMVLCCRLMGSPREIIRGSGEVAFRALVAGVTRAPQNTPVSSHCGILRRFIDNLVSLV